MKRKHKKSYYFIILLLVVVGLSVGNALLQTTLTINGTTKIKGNTWDIHFANLNVADGSVAIGTGDYAATIQSSTTDITYTITLNEPGDFYEFTVDAVNTGSIDGMVESVTSKFNNQPITTLPNYLNCSVTYETGDDIELNHLLKAGDIETYKVRIEFKKDISSSDLPTSVQTITLDFGVIYVQADSNGVEVEHPLNGIVYTVNKYDSNATEPLYNVVWLNREYSKMIPFFETPTEALSAIATVSGKDLPFYLKHKIENGIVTESYVEFIVTEAMAQTNTGMVPGTYTLRGVGTYDLDLADYIVDENYVSPYYEMNKEALKTAFGYSTNLSRCNEQASGISKYFYCDVPNFGAGTYVDGRVYASFDFSMYYCDVFKTGYASCHW